MDLLMPGITSTKDSCLYNSSETDTSDQGNDNDDDDEDDDVSQDDDDDDGERPTCELTAAAAAADSIVDTKKSPRTIRFFLVNDLLTSI